MTLRLCRRHPEAKIDGQRVKLTWQTWQLLGFLSDADGGPLSNAELCNLFHLSLELNTANWHILQIVHHARDVFRREGVADLIETVPGQGYRLRGMV